MTTLRDCLHYKDLTDKNKIHLDGKTMAVISERKGLIFVVDDDVNFNTLMTGYLRSQGYEVEVAESGGQAIQKLKAVTPDLIISDVVMPDLNGFELAEMIRNMPEVNWVPIIFLSARDQSSDRVQGLSAGATAYMVKPFDLQELTAQIESSLRSLQLIQQTRAKRSESRILVPVGVKLTNTELNVARLVAQGLSNLEIAQRLNASKRTIESHISHMLKKTLLSNRTELSRWIIESGME